MVWVSTNNEISMHTMELSMKKMPNPEPPFWMVLLGCVALLAILVWIAQNADSPTLHLMLKLATPTRVGA